MIRRIIDISHHEDPIDFAKVADDGIIAIIAKATEGVTWVDPAYAKFKNAAAKVRLQLPRSAALRPSTLNPQPSTFFLWGSYHFGTGADVKAQVNHYLATARPTDDELVCLDFEENPSGSSMSLLQAREFVSIYRERTARYPVLYGGAWLKAQLNGKADNVLAQCPVWISQYGPRPVLPPGWKKYVLWQYTDGRVGPEPHTVNGIGPCDRNQYDGTITQLRKVWPFS